MIVLIPDHCRSIYFEKNYLFEKILKFLFVMFPENLAEQGIHCQLCSLTK